MSYSKLIKLKYGIKNGTDVTLKLSLNVAGDFNDENNFLHEFFSTYAQVSELHKDSGNNSSTNISHQNLIFIK